MCHDRATTSNAPRVNVMMGLVSQAPSQLLIQVPRFGKKFKTYSKIVPELKMDIGELLTSPCKSMHSINVTYAYFIMQYYFRPSQCCCFVIYIQTIALNVME